MEIFEALSGTPAENGTSDIVKFGKSRWQALSSSISFILRIFLGLFINSMLNGVEIRKFGNE